MEWVKTILSTVRYTVIRNLTLVSKKLGTNSEIRPNQSGTYVIRG